MTRKPTASPARTAKEHLEEADRIVQHVNDANALVGRLRSGLENARSTLEALKPAQHQMVKIREPYHHPNRETSDKLAASIIAKEIELIDQILGDRK